MTSMKHPAKIPKLCLTTHVQTSHIPTPLCFPVFQHTQFLRKKSSRLTSHQHKSHPPDVPTIWNSLLLVQPQHPNPSPIILYCQTRFVSQSQLHRWFFPTTSTQLIWLRQLFDGRGTKDLQYSNGPSSESNK